MRRLLQKWVRVARPVVFFDRLRSDPVSRVFGFDRGTPIDRFYIERFLGESSLSIRGSVLEVGGDDYTRRFGGSNVSSSDVLDAARGRGSAAVPGDLTDPSTLPASRYDCFICTQTFNFIFDAAAAVAGAHHVLKPGGLLLATVAGISQVSRYDMDRWGDYWRFTTASVRRLFEPVFLGGVEVESFGNALAASAFLQGLAVEDLPNRFLLDDNDPDYQLLITIVARRAA